MNHISGLDEAKMHAVGDERIDREREFHNTRFSTSTRQAQDKYYEVVEHGKRVYLDTVRTLARGADVLEYGCSNGVESIRLAPTCKSVVGIDISDVAIDQAAQAARRQGVTNARFLAMNAERMEFPDDQFDLAFGGGIVHHLDVEQAFREVARVLRPGGTAVFWEPLGHNPVINLYRRRTPEARTADEHPLLRQDFKVAERFFSTIDVRFYGLTTLGAVPFRNTPLFKPVYALTRAVDRALFLIPGVKWQAWYSLSLMKV